MKKPYLLVRFKPRSVMPSGPPSRDTRTTLLERLRDPADAAAWERFHTLYFDLIVRYARNAGLSLFDAEDIAQAVLVGFVKAVRTFRYDRTRGRFRSYLGRCTSNAILRFRRCPEFARAALDDLDTPDCGFDKPGDHGADAAWEHEWVAFHYRKAVEAMRERCNLKSIEVLNAHARGLSVAQIAQVHAMSEDAVHKTVQRLRTRLAEQIALQIRLEDDGYT
ncbi:MAG: sigma-70 family RNA polymerase sigma factor [Phycisphaerae bacterium]|nr:sigma-70 family RNA polymerase sigma factor [Phycisphaerae bacterium]